MRACVRALKHVQTFLQPFKGRRGRELGGGKKRERKKKSHGAFSEMAGRGGKKMCIPNLEHHVMTVSEENCNTHTHLCTQRQLFFPPFFTIPSSAPQQTAGLQGTLTRGARVCVRLCVRERQASVCSLYPPTHLSAKPRRSVRVKTRDVVQATDRGNKGDRRREFCQFFSNCAQNFDKLYSWMGFCGFTKQPSSAQRLRALLARFRTLHRAEMSLSRNMAI